MTNDDNGHNQGPRAFVVTVMYLDHDGAKHAISALVLASGEYAAIRATVETVSGWPNCKSLIGGTVEPAPDEYQAAAVEAASNGGGDNVVPMRRRPDGATVH